MIALREAAALAAAVKAEGHNSVRALQLEAEAGFAKLITRGVEQKLGLLKTDLHRQQVVRQIDATGATVALHVVGKAPAGVTLDDATYRICKVAKGEFNLTGGGEVVGTIPEGLPSSAMPNLDLGKLGSLFSAVLVISLVGFMEAISIAKAIAAKTKQCLDPNQELIGQGLSNIVGSMTQAFPVSGSFSRAAVKHAWEAHKHDGIAAGITFVATLAAAPDLDHGIMVGAGLALILFLIRTMKPRVAQLGRFKDGTLRGRSRSIRVFRPTNMWWRCASTVSCTSAMFPSSKTPCWKRWRIIRKQSISWWSATASINWMRPAKR